MTLRKRRPDLLEDELAQRLPARGHDGRVDGTADRALAEDFDPIVRDALAALSPNHRAVIALVDLDGLSYQEAADLLHVPAGTVMSRLHRARKKVRTRPEQHGITELPRSDGAARLPLPVRPIPNCSNASHDPSTDSPPTICRESDAQRPPQLQA